MSFLFIGSQKYKYERKILLPPIFRKSILNFGIENPQLFKSKQNVWHATKLS